MHDTENATKLTFFRNHLSATRAKTRRLAPNINGTQDPVLTDSGNVRAAGTMKNHTGYDYIGNVLGYSGMSGFVYEPALPNTGAAAIGRMGYWDQDWNNQDGSVAGTMLRDGNYDHVTSSVHWHGLGGAGSTPVLIPASLYRTSKPAFFGSNPWPWVNALGTTKTYEGSLRRRHAQRMTTMTKRASLVVPSWMWPGRGLDVTWT